jgi:solute carrier family 25 (mitochondrial carrier protein), member 16
MGVFKALGQIMRTEGIKGVYRGNSATLFRIFPYAAVQYMSFEQYRRWLVPNSNDLTSPNSNAPAYLRLVAGSMAGATSVLCTYPLDLMRTRLVYQVAATPYVHVLSALKRVYQERGFTYLYRGLGPTLLGILPYAGVSFFTYGNLKSFCYHYIPTYTLRRSDHEELKISVRLACGAMAGALGQTASYPLDIIRRRMQAHELSAHVPLYRNIPHAIQTIWKSQGFRGFYVGLSVNYIKVAPAVSISFVSFELLKKELNRFSFYK